MSIVADLSLRSVLILPQLGLLAVWLTRGRRCAFFFGDLAGI